jgi:hypothetical protein
LYQILWNHFLKICRIAGENILYFCNALRHSTPQNFLAFFLHGNKNLLSAMHSSESHDEMKKERSMLTCYYARRSEWRFMSGVDIIAPVLRDAERHSFLLTCYCCIEWTYDKFTPSLHLLFPWFLWSIAHFILRIRGILTVMRNSIININHI